MKPGASWSETRAFAAGGTMTSTMLLAATLLGLARGAATVEVEAREILDELLRVDTSHGNLSLIHI